MPVTSPYFWRTPSCPNFEVGHSPLSLTFCWQHPHSVSAFPSMTYFSIFFLWNSHVPILLLQFSQHFHSILPSGYVKIAIENGPVEIVDFPIENDGSFHSYVSLPEGKPPFSYGFPRVFLWFSYGFPSKNSLPRVVSWHAEASPSNGHCHGTSPIGAQTSPRRRNGHWPCHFRGVNILITMVYRWYIYS